MLPTNFLEDFKKFYTAFGFNDDDEGTCESVSMIFTQYLYSIGIIKLTNDLDDDNGVVYESEDNGLVYQSDDSAIYESDIELIDGQLVVTSNQRFPVNFDKNCIYNVSIDGVNVTNYGEGDPTNYGHCFYLLYVDDKWKILDTFAGQRGITLYNVDINELNSFIERNEKKLNCDDYNRFFHVNITNSDDITNLDFIIDERRLI